MESQIKKGRINPLISSNLLIQAGDKLTILFILLIFCLSLVAAKKDILLMVSTPFSHSEDRNSLIAIFSLLIDCTVDLSDLAKTDDNGIFLKLFVNYLSAGKMLYSI